ncbi:MAG: MerR family transcriptional regulator [Desulfurella sp.]|uniref:MerR family transcriptional regulator n=1 Tax=Desulfurella sp. TaxID=1962857 RepID=UPI003CB9051C
MRFKKDVYSIGVFCKIVDIHPQTLREYEKSGIIKPKRTKGNVRFFTDEDIEDIRFIKEMTKTLGVNLAGVDVIMRLKNQIKDLEKLIEELYKRIQELNARENNTLPVVKEDTKKPNIIEIKIET